MRLRNQSNQFVQVADRLLGAMKSNQSEVSAAMQEAQGYNIVSSKSTKVLPMSKQTDGKVNSIKQGKFLIDQQNSYAQERLRVSESVKNII